MHTIDCIASILHLHPETKLKNMHEIIYSIILGESKKFDPFHIQISRELIARICLFPCVQLT